MIKELDSRHRAGEWTYVLVTIAAFVFIPEVRRIADWRGAYDPLNAFAVVPLLLLCPIGILAYKERKFMRASVFPIFALILISGFAYALLVGTARGAITSGLYALAQFVLPIVVGFWLLSRPESMEFCYRRLASWLLLFGAIAGLYGIIQYIFAPPWDTAWMQDLGFGSFGKPVPFGIRVFGVLNSPGTYALFMGAVLLLNLPFIKFSNWLSSISILLVVLGLTLSFVRSGWLAVILGVIVFVTLSPNRLAPILSLTYVGIVCAVGTLAFVALVPDQNLGEKLWSRVSTLSDVTEDGSTADRADTSLTTLSLALKQPIGAGLGLAGGGSKLQTSAVSLLESPDGIVDNGFVARFFEMGLIGFCAFMLASVYGIATTIGSYRRQVNAGDPLKTQIVASCLAVEIMMVLLNLSGDNQQGVLAVLFFISVSVPLLYDRSLTTTRSFSEFHDTHA